jgi:PAT family beta-lactamase induction signal transducer AmpG
MLQQRPAWLAALLTRRMLVCVLVGFSSGLPLYLLLNLVPAWLKTEGLSLKQIGAFALIQFPYTWKFLWSPLLDRFALPVLGRRRGWMLLTQLGLLAAIASLGGLLPASQVAWVVALTTAIAVLSATQDIVLDAFRREILQDSELGLGNAFYVNAYKLAQLVPGSLALILADHLPWRWVFLITALFMLPGMLTTLLVREPVNSRAAPATLQQAVLEPFQEFFSRQGVRSACLILVFILLYKLGDSLCTALATPFYLDMGFSKTEIGLVAKNAALWPSVTAGILGGLWMVKMGINRALWVFGVLQWVAILGFVGLAAMGTGESSFPRLCALAVVIGLEAAGAGLGTTAFVAYMARTTHPAYTATQLALFTSLMAVPRTFINASAGWLVEGGSLSLPWGTQWVFGGLGWLHFFVMCTALAVPGMLLLFKLAPWNESSHSKEFLWS